MGDYLQLELLEAIIEEEMFDSLRTKQQLGYYVSCGLRYTKGVPGLTFTIESSAYSPLDLQPKILDFIQSFIARIDEKMYSNFLEGMISRKCEPLKDIYADSSYLMGCLKTYLPESPGVRWDKKSLEVEYLRTQMSYDKVIATYKRVLLDNPRMVIFRTFANKHSDQVQMLELEQDAVKKESEVLDKLKAENCIKMYMW